MVALLVPISLRSRWDEPLTDNAERYTAILVNIYAKQLKSLWFQPHRATAHSARISMAVFREIFPGPEAIASMFAR